MSAMEHEKDILMEEKQIQEDQSNSKEEMHSAKKSHGRRTRSRQKKNEPRPRPRRMEEKSFSESPTDCAEEMSDEPTVESVSDTAVSADAEQCSTECQHQADDMELVQTESLSLIHIFRAEPPFRTGGETNMAELWDVYDENRRLTGKTHVRGLPMAPGEYHLVGDVWTVNFEMCIRDSIQSL